jgi:DNA-binding NarL/FixJ family response regulator
MTAATAWLYVILSPIRAPPAATPTTRKESLSLSALTSREHNVLPLVAAGSSYKQVAVRLGIRLSTAKAYEARWTTL